MTLKELLEEVEAAIGAIRIRTLATLHTDLERYEKVLMPELARRLKWAMKGLEYALTHFREICPTRRDLSGTERSAAFQSKIEIIEGPSDSGASVVENATQECPKCGCLMGWRPMSHGWYCAIDHIFIPDDCIDTP